MSIASVIMGLIYFSAFWSCSRLCTSPTLLLTRLSHTTTSRLTFQSFRYKYASPFKETADACDSFLLIMITLATTSISLGCVKELLAFADSYMAGALGVLWLMEQKYLLDHVSYLVAYMIECGLPTTGHVVTYADSIPRLTHLLVFSAALMFTVPFCLSESHIFGFVFCCALSLPVSWVHACAKAFKIRSVFFGMSLVSGLMSAFLSWRSTAAAIGQKSITKKHELETALDGKVERKEEDVLRHKQSIHRLLG